MLTKIPLISNMAAAISTFFDKILESSSNAERQEFEAYMAGCSSACEVEARERSWATRGKQRSGF